MRTLLAAAILAALLGPLTPQPVVAAGSLFGAAELPEPEPDALPKWQQAMERIALEEPAYRACAAGRACPSRAVQGWLTLLASLAKRPALERIRGVNDFINGWPYRSDASNYGHSDYWATPLEFLGRSGDCEDYAIAKYVSLRRLGLPASALRMVVVQDTVRDIAHAVLIARSGGTWYVLDNLSQEFLPERRVTHYVPYYSINETARWAYAPGDELIAASGTP